LPLTIKVHQVRVMAEYDEAEDENLILKANKFHIQKARGNPVSHAMAAWDFRSFNQRQNVNTAFLPV
jgi:hypothetical protein